MGLLPSLAWAQERPLEVDPNTKIQGGADVRGSGANAGAGTGAQSEDKIDTGKARPDPRDEKSGPEKDKPTSERKPKDASQGETAPKRSY